MKKVNLLSKAEMRNVLGGGTPGQGGNSMHCRDSQSELIGETINVDNCDTENFDTYCKERENYDRSKSNCNSWGIE